MLRRIRPVIPAFTSPSFVAVYVLIFLVLVIIAIIVFQIRRKKAHAAPKAKLPKSKTLSKSSSSSTSFEAGNLPSVSFGTPPTTIVPRTRYDWTEDLS
ncbi:hypothetical protein GCK32_010512 [Trichostrongylus colubriformis]|uniref:Uncharacterized protein n=1 Tax=Trichostrongylus colubriformis TaxID=6319 RepID=A0AAN8F6G3_TRICO